MANIYKQIKNRRLSRQKTSSNFYDCITNKKSGTTQMMLLAEFFNKEKVEQDVLIKTIFNRIERDPYDYFIQKIAMRMQFTMIRRNYGIYFRSIGGNNPYMKMMTTKEEFEELLGRIDHRIENLEIEKTNVKDIISDLGKYKDNIRKTFDALKLRDSE